VIPLAQTGIEGGGAYLAAAYAVFVALLIVYVGIMASRLVRIERKIGDLATRLEGAGGGARANDDDHSG
jgi:hypothetical protein